MNDVVGETCQTDEDNDGSNNMKISIENCVLLEREDVSTYFEKLEGSQPPQNIFNLKDCNDFSSSDINIEEHIEAIKKSTEYPKNDKQGTSTPDNITLEMSASILGIPIHLNDNNSNNNNNTSNNFLNDLYPEYNISSSSSIVNPISDQTINDICTEFNSESIISYLPIDNTDINNTQNINYLNDSDSLLLVIPSNNSESSSSNCIIENQAYELYANGELAITDVEPIPLDKTTEIQPKYTPKCILCNNFFENIKDLKYHKKIHNIKPDVLTEHTCIICQSVFNNYCSLMLHYNKIHKQNQLHESDVTYNGRKAYKCQICYAIFTDLNTFFSHNSPYDYISNLVNYCKICDIKFNEDTQKFIQHCNIIHNNDMCFECKICSTKMQLKSSLRRHIQFNHNIKKIYCKQCKSCLIASGYVKTHLENNDKNICTNVCPLCDSPISVSKDLQIKHIKDHLNNLEATFQCGICLNYFYTYYNFLSHSKALHNGIVNIIPLNIIIKSIELKTVNCRVSNHDELIRYINLDVSDVPLELNSSNIIQEQRRNDCIIISNTVIDDSQSCSSNSNNETLSNLPNKKKSLEYFCEYCLDKFPTYKLLSIHLEKCNSKDKKLPKQYEQFIEGNKVHGDTSRKIKITKEKDFITEKNKIYLKPKSQLSNLKSDRKSIPCTITSKDAAILENQMDRNVNKLSDNNEIMTSEITKEKRDLIQKQLVKNDISNSNSTVNKSSSVNMPEIFIKSKNFSNSVNNTDIVSDSLNNTMSNTVNNIVNNIPNSVVIPKSCKNSTVSTTKNPFNITFEVISPKNTTAMTNIINNIPSKPNLLNSMLRSNCVSNTIMSSSLNNIEVITNCKNALSVNKTDISNAVANITLDTVNNIELMASSENNTSSLQNSIAVVANSVNNIAVMANSINNKTLQNDIESNSCIASNNIAIMANSIKNTTAIVPNNTTSMVSSVTNIQAVTSLIITNDIVPNQKYENNNLIHNQIEDKNSCTYPISSENLGLIILPVANISTNPVIINNTNLPIINQYQSINKSECHKCSKNETMNDSPMKPYQNLGKTSKVSTNLDSKQTSKTYDNESSIKSNKEESVFIIPSTSSQNNGHKKTDSNNSSNQVSKDTDFNIVTSELICSDTNSGVKIDIVDHAIKSNNAESKPRSKKSMRKKRKVKNNEKVPVVKKSRFDNKNQPIPSFEGNLNIPCLICQKKCINTFDLELHIKNKHNACKLCEIIFDTQDELKEHENDHKIGKIYFYMCLCTKSFKNIDSLNQHIHENMKNKKTYNGFGLITEHGIMLKRKIIDLYIKNNMYVLPTKAICSYCNDIFDNELLDDHNEIIHNVCMCTNCDVRYVRTDIVKSKIDGDVLYLCNNCMKPDL